MICPKLCWRPELAEGVISTKWMWEYGYEVYVLKLSLFVQYNSIYYSGFPDCGALSRICSFYSELGSQKWETTSFARNGGRVYTSLMTGNAGILSNLYIAFSGRIVRCTSLLPVTQRWGVWFSMIWYCTNNNTNNNTTLQHSVITATFLSKGFP